jgi:hypothetical protein
MAVMAKCGEQMEKIGWHVVLFGAVMIAVLLGIIWSTAEPGLCGIPIAAAALRDNQATWCFEFWLNRYQQLITGMLSLAAAILAALFVWKQIKTAEEQLKITAGFIEPEFWLTPDPDEYTDNDAVGKIVNHLLSCANQNRSTIELISIKLIEPSGVCLEVNGRIWREESGETNRPFKVNKIIPGTRPSASMVEKATIKVSFDGRVPPHLVINQTTRIKLELEYKIFTPSQRVSNQTISTDAQVLEAI